MEKTKLKQNTTMRDINKEDKLILIKQIIIKKMIKKYLP